jgi:hypothetical protein
MRKLFRLLAAAASICASTTEAFSLTEAQQERCSAVTEDSVIRAATKGFIENGKRNRQQGLVDNENPWPFASYDELRSKYPNCCRVSREYKGDYSPALKPHLAGGKKFPIFIVEITLPSLTGNGASKKRYQYKGNFLVTCYGHIVTESHLDTEN